MPGPVLVVDDEPHIRKIIKLKLAPLGIETVEARDGLEAWEKLSSVRPALVILDIMMPKLDGISFLKRARETEEWKRLPVIIVSAVRDEEERNRALSLGALDVLWKPFSISDLVAKVRRCIEAPPPAQDGAGQGA